MAGLALFKGTALVVAALAVSIGAIGKLKPELFLKLPMGFVLWAMTGNVMPPYFDATPFGEEEFGTWARDGDLMVSVGAKSGTNWMLYCAHQIRTKAKGDTATDYTDILLDTPWVGFRMLPGQTWAEIKEMMNSSRLPDGTRVKDYWDKPTFPFRIFKSHFAPPVAPVERFGGVKWLAMVRNGKDVVRSFFPFFRGHRPGFKELWGGFPPSYADARACLNDFLPGGTLEHLYFGYVRDWWAHRHAPNVLLLHYTDAKKDLAGTVARIARFVGVDLTADEAKEVTRRCDIKHMKTVSHKFDYVQWAGDGSKLMCGKDGCSGVDGSLIRAGQVGEGEEFFDEEMNKLWAAALESELADPALRKWASEGGAFQ